MRKPSAASRTEADTVPDIVLYVQPGFEVPGHRRCISGTPFAIKLARVLQYKRLPFRVVEIGRATATIDPRFSFLAMLLATTTAVSITATASSIWSVSIRVASPSSSAPAAAQTPSGVGFACAHGSNEKIRFQSSFMLITTQPLFLASSYSAGVKVPTLVLGSPWAGP
jgi:hypothetical protein